MDSFDLALRDRLGRLADGVPYPATPGAGALPELARRPIRPGASGWASLGTLLAIIVTISWIVLVPGPGGPSAVPGVAVDDDDRGIVWDSGLVRLEAESVRIETPNGTFRATDVVPITDADIGMSLARRSPSPEKPRYERYRIEYVDFVVRSDPGSRHYRTLEVYWQEHGVQMRMYIYFAADDTHWWATEVRVYDGGEPGDWIGWGGAMAWTDRDFRRWDERRCGYDRTPAAGCPDGVDLGLFRSRRGEAWAGDLDLLDGVGHANGAGRVTGELHIEGMRLSAFGE